MGGRIYFIISLILFTNLVLSPVSVDAGELGHQYNDETDSEIPIRDPDIDPGCFRLRRRQDFCGPPNTSTNP